MINSQIHKLDPIKMPSCELCKEFVQRRRNIFDKVKSKQIPIDDYYIELDDDTFSRGLLVCTECYVETCRQVGQGCDEEVKKMVEVNGPSEEKLREKNRMKKQNLIKQVENLSVASGPLFPVVPSGQLKPIRSSNTNCRGCEWFGNVRKSGKLSDEYLMQEFIQCSNCLNFCIENNIECPDIENRKQRSEKELDYRSLTKKTNISNITSQIKKSKPSL
jgi:hypothetical protein